MKNFSFLTKLEKNKEKLMQAEAYMIMTYECKECKIKERIWNSRDGVTPFLVGCKVCDGIMKHIDWDKDGFDPDYQPKDDDRVFVDLTMQRALEKASRQVEKMWNDPVHPMSKRWVNKKEAIRDLAKMAMKEFAPHTPDLISGIAYRKGKGGGYIGVN
jgi:hypothetical protein